MKKLSLKGLNLNESNILSRQQKKLVLGGGWECGCPQYSYCHEPKPSCEQICSGSTDIVCLPE